MNKIISILLASLFVAYSTSHCMSSEEKLRMIDKEIAEAQKQKTSGLIMTGAGTGLVVLGYAAFLPSIEFEYSSSSGSSTVEHGNSTLFWVCVVSGVVLECWGGYKWWDGAQTVSRLKAKRYDISFSPLLIPEENNVKLGLAMNVRY